MNADRLLALYEKVAEAPDALPRLRRFVLDLAVRGKLVAQDPTDEPASELLTTIARERNTRVKRREIKRAAPSEPVEDHPFEAPAGWEWIPLGDTGNIFSGNSINATTREQLEKTDEGLPFIATKDVGYGLDVIDYENGLLVPASDSRFKVARAKSVLICAEGGSAGRKIGLSDREICFGNKLLANETWSVIVPEFVRFVYMSDFFFDEFAARMTGVIGGISLRNFLQLPFPLPPLAEQRRIVAKVEELMELLDRLETARAAREATRDRLTAASLARLTPPDAYAAAFPANARFALATLPALTTRPDQIKPLRQTILNLAVRGKLVEQDPTDEPLPRIDKGLSPDSAAPFDIPKGWQWSRLRALGTLKGGGTPSKARDDFWNGRIPWVSPKDMKVDYIEAAQLTITDAAVAGSAVNLIGPESVLFVVRGMILAHSFPVAISKVPVTINQDMKAIILREPEMAEYILRALKGLTPEMLARVQRSSHGTCRIEGSDYRDFLIPLPPLAEQHRIVAKVDALMALCDRLEAALTTADTTRARLLEALLHEALDPATSELEAAE